MMNAKLLGRVRFIHPILRIGHGFHITPKFTAKYPKIITHDKKFKKIERDLNYFTKETRREYFLSYYIHVFD